MTAWEARIVGEEWALEWGGWCAATRAPETPAQRYAAIPLEGCWPGTMSRPTVIRGAGPDHPWDAATREKAASGPGAANRMDGGRVLTRQEASPPPHHPSRRQRTPGYPTGSARAFLNETALPAVRALNGAGAPTLLPAMQRIVNAIQPGLISPEAALYGHWMEWGESNRSGRPLSMGDTLRLTEAGSAMSLRSSAQALLHALRTRYHGDTAP